MPKVLIVSYFTLRKCCVIFAQARLNLGLRPPSHWRSGPSLSATSGTFLGNTGACRCGSHCYICDDVFLVSVELTVQRFIQTGTCIIQWRFATNFETSNLRQCTWRESLSVFEHREWLITMSTKEGLARPGRSSINCFITQLVTERYNESNNGNLYHHEKRLACKDWRVESWEVQLGHCN